MKSGIYQIRHVETGKVYVGSAVNFPRRFALHRCNLRAGKHRNTKLQNAWNKYGESAFRFERVLICSKANLITYEQACIDGFSAVSDGYNILGVAGSALGFRHSAEHRSKLLGNQHAQGHKHDADTLRLISEASKGNTHSLGHRHSDNARRNIAEGHRGIKQDPEWVSKRIAGHVGAKRSESAIANMRAAWVRRKEAAAQ